MIAVGGAFSRAPLGVDKYMAGDERRGKEIPAEFMKRISVLNGILVVCTAGYSRELFYLLKRAKMANARVVLGSLDANREVQELPTCYTDLAIWI